MSMVRGRGAGTRPLWGGSHRLLYSDVLRTCACRLDNIFRSGNIYFGAAIILQSDNTYFKAAIYISEQQ